MPDNKRPAWKLYLTVEPVMFFFAYGITTSLPLYRQYFYWVISEMKGFPYAELLMSKDDPGCHGDIISQNSTLKKLEEEVQSMAAKIDMGYMFFVAIPSLLVAPFWGPWTDKSGRRKPAIASAIIGSCLETIFVLTIMYCKLPVYLMFVAAVISGFSGFLPNVVLGCMSYIADTTEKTQVALRLAILQLLVFMAGVLSQLTSGLWISKFGFIAPTWLLLACHLTAAIWLIFLVPESQRVSVKVKTKFFNLKNLKALVNVLKQPRPEGLRKCLLLLLTVGSILTSTIQGLGGVTALFVMRSPLCFGPKPVGYFIAYRMFIFGFGGAVGVKLFTFFFSEKFTGAIGIISQIVEMGVLSFANRTWLVFLAPTLAFFKGCAGPVVLAMMTRIVREDERGSLFCVNGIVTVLAQFVGVMLFNNVYEATLEMGFNGFVFLVCATIKLIPFTILSLALVPPPIKERTEVDEETNLEKAREESKEEDGGLLIKKSNNRDYDKNGNDNLDETRL